MGIIPTITCKKCDRRYSGLKSRCPHCGAARSKPTTRTAATTAAAQPGTPANARMQENAKWQAIFGVVLLVAVIAAVIALITIGLSGEEEPAPTPTVEITPPPPPTPTPTPPTPTPPEVSAIQINYGNEQRTEFAMSIGNKIPLNATIYPLDLEATANWSSTDEDICTIDKDGVVTAVGSGWGMVIAECGGVEAKCHVLVW